jgi:KDO2-lipid IV(A) lauroyltransferase
MWHHLLLMLCEISQASRKVHRSNWHEHFHIPDRRAVLEVIFDQRPKILVTGHFGNFELAGFVTGLFGISNTTIGRPLDNRFLQKFFNDFRSASGQHFIDKEGSAVAIQDLLDAGGTLALLADQHAGDRGVWAEFLGVPASCHKALALFTLHSHAPMMVVYNRRLDRPLQFELSTLGKADPAIGGENVSGVRQLTQWYNDALEPIIRANPEQYWWVHRRWRARPKKAKRQNKTAA